MIKSRLKEFFKKFSFTPTERLVVISLVGAFLVGLGIQFYRSAASETTGFDYSAVDSEFISKSLLPGTDSGGPPGGRSGEELTEIVVTGGPSTGITVRLNSATKAELMTLPGVGETIAERILHYRIDHGRFNTVRDLLKVKGVGEKKLLRLAPFCVVED